MRRRHSALRAVLVLTLIATTGALMSPTAPAAGAEGCQVDPTTGKGFGVGCPGQQPGQSGQPGDEDDDQGGPGDGNSDDPAGPPPCDWKPSPLGNGMEAYLRAMFPEAPPDAVFQYNDCSTIGPGLVYTQYRWVPPGEATPPDPEQLAVDFWVDVRAGLPSPEVATDPPDGQPAVIHVPTFVEVTNWEDEISRTRCMLGVCVTIVATPRLTFDPGEPGTTAVECDPPGTRFDPGGPDPDDQAAADGACAHVYEHRTGTAGRPERWPGQVTVTWDATWTSNVGASGSFDPVALSDEVPRAVRELPTVVVDVGSADG